MALKRIVVDTSAYAAFKRSHPLATEALRRAHEILLPAVVLGELLAGFESGSRRARNRQELDDFRRSMRVRHVPATEETAERYAYIYAHLRAVGRPIPTNDLWIAAAAMEHSADLLTADAHYQYVPQIVVTRIA